jgi:hypothetical protein
MKRTLELKRTLLTTAIIAALATPAFASVTGDEINNNSGVANNGSINGSTILNNSGPGAGGTFSPSVENKNTNTNLNTNTNVNVSSSNSAAVSGSKSSARQSQGQYQGQSQNARSSVKESGNSSNTNVIEAQKRNPVSTAYAAPLVAADDTCMGSSSVGGQGVGFGLSFGSTWQDDDCVRRKDSREWRAMGYPQVALARMCQNAENRQAAAASGVQCPETTISYHDRAELSGSPVTAAYPTTDTWSAKH